MAKRQGSFQNMDPETRARYSRMGGLAAHRAGTAHEWTTEEARAAALKGVAKRRELRAQHREDETR